MDRRLVVGHRLGRSLAVVVVAVALAAVAGLVAGPAQAWTEYAHGGIDPAECSICHPDDHTTSDRPVTNERCMGCHSYAIPDPSLTCWTCHTPGQDMGGARNDAACTQSCHLADGTTTRHTAHPDRSATCTTCHPLTASSSSAGGSPHHTAPVPPPPAVTGMDPASGRTGTVVTLTGAHFTRATAVTFGAAPSGAFTVVSDTRITALVPAGAATGVVAVTTAGGSGTSATPFVVVPAAPMVATLLPATGPPGSTVTVTGSGFAGATAVTFNGLPAAFSVVSAAAITATVPAGATSGPVAVTTTGGTGVSATSYAVVPQAAAALSLTVAPAAVAPGGAVKASGLLTPVSLAGSPVRLSVQRKKSGAWVSVKTVVVATKASGAFAWTYRPARTGPYRVKASIAATVAHTAAQTSWRGFSVR